VARDDAEEALKTLPPCLNDLVRKAVREDFARERGDVHASGLVLEDIAERLKV
jgi:hypothetical protein